MPKTVTLPTTAQDNMSDQGKAKSSENAPTFVVTPPPVNVLTSTSADEVFQATSGPDLFVFEASQPQGDDVILGYDPTMDRIRLENQWGGFYAETENGLMLHSGDYSGRVDTILIQGQTLAMVDQYDSITILGTDGSTTVI